MNNEGPKHSDMQRHSRSVWMYVLRTSELHWVQYQISVVLEICYDTKSIVWLHMKLLVGILTKEAIPISCLDVLLMNWEGYVLHEGRQILRCRQGATVAGGRGGAAVASTEQETRSRYDGEQGEEEPSWLSS